MGDKKVLIIMLIILSILFSIFLFLNNFQHERDSPINVNTCSVEMLESLPGIGVTLAARIVQQRPYLDIYELSSVRGIGEKTFNKIKDRVVVN